MATNTIRMSGVRFGLEGIAWAVSIAFVGVGAVVLGVWPTIAIFAVRARCAIGYWPSYNHPDPALLTTISRGDVLEIASMCAVVSVLTVAGAWPLRRVHALPRPAAALLVGLVLAYVGLTLGIVDPAGLADWYFD